MIHSFSHNTEFGQTYFIPSIIYISISALHTWIIPIIINQLTNRLSTKGISPLDYILKSVYQQVDVVI